MLIAHIKDDLVLPPIRHLSECSGLIKPQETNAENLLGYFLEGQKFSCYYRAGSYMLVFSCPEKKLAIEWVDIHQGLADSKRKNFLENEGVSLLQFHCDEVFNHPAKVFRQIEGVLNKERGF